MGDRAYMSLRCRVDGRGVFENLGFTMAETFGDGTCEMVDEERNYADTDELPRNIPFYGDHASGGTYGEGIFACDGERWAYCESLHSRRQPSVGIGPDGLPQESTDEARLFYEVQAAAEKALGVTRAPLPDRTWDDRVFAAQQHGRKAIAHLDAALDNLRELASECDDLAALMGWREDSGMVLAAIGAAKAAFERAESVAEAIEDAHDDAEAKSIEGGGA